MRTVPTRVLALVTVAASCAGALTHTPALSAPAAAGTAKKAVTAPVPTTTAKQSAQESTRAVPIPKIRAVGQPELCVTSGKVDTAASRLHVDAGAMRAVIAGDDSSVAELDFTYRGPSAQTAPLANGEIRRQIGLKLRAKDTCNVTYIMWHAAPTEGIAVSVKYNPGKSTHEACGDGGYISVKPTSSSPVPHLKPNDRHLLRGEIIGTTLRVLVDGAVVWTGPLPSQAFTFNGPAGVRSDNGAYDFDLRVIQPRATGARCL